tara:strand:+ start:353 stop:682 length:330 start_codon:yes stop_codon:yes gene_type:complete
MKITKQQLKQIIKEELEATLDEADSFSARKALSNSISDAIIGHLENEKFFGDEMGGIPQSVIKVINNSALLVADAVEGTEAEPEPEEYVQDWDEDYDEDDRYSYLDEPQ